MRPSEIRRMILDDHAALRAGMADLRDLVREYAKDDEDREARVRELGAAFRLRFLRHLELEDRYLVPALRRIDSWGPERAGRVTDEHRDQRQRLDVLLEHLRDDGRPGEALVAELDQLVDDLLGDMEHEERTVLREDLLRDDVISINAETG